jgi:hypothetical protein
MDDWNMGWRIGYPECAPSTTDIDDSDSKHMVAFTGSAVYRDDSDADHDSDIEDDFLTGHGSGILHGSGDDDDDDFTALALEYENSPTAPKYPTGFVESLLKKYKALEDENMVLKDEIKALKDENTAVNSENFALKEWNTQTLSFVDHTVSLVHDQDQVAAVKQSQLARLPPPNHAKALKLLQAQRKTTYLQCEQAEQATIKEEIRLARIREQVKKEQTKLNATRLEKNKLRTKNPGLNVDIKDSHLEHNNGKMQFEAGSNNNIYINNYGF